MKAAVLHAVGQLPRFEDFPEPIPTRDQVVVEVTAAPLTAFDRARAAGTHYAPYAALPAVCGISGAGRLPDGTRALFGSHAGTMAERTAVNRDWCLPIPDRLDEIVAAAAFNPGISAWGTLAWRAGLQGGERVLVLGATGVTGKLAVQYARRLGARDVIAAGRNQRVLDALPDLGATSTIQLDQPDDALARAFQAHCGNDGYDVVVDYVWGHATEVFLDAIANRTLEPRSSRTRLVQVGETAGPRVTLPASILRSTGLEIMGMGSGNMPPAEMLRSAIEEQLQLLASGELRVDVERVPLSTVATVWNRDQAGRRPVFIP